MLLFQKNNFFFLLLFVVEILFSQHYPSTNFSTLNGLSNNSVYAILKDSRSIVWVGTANGVSAIQNGSVQNYNTIDGLAHNSCWAIVEDGNQNLWFGSYGGGLTFYDGKNFQIINTKKGLVNDQIRTLFVHGKYLYVGTQYGFSVVDVVSRKVVYSDKIKGEKGLFQVMGFYIQNSKVSFTTFDDGIWNVNVVKKSMHLENHEIPHVFSIFQTKSNLYCSHIDIGNGYFNQMSIFNSDNKLLNRYRSGTIVWDFAQDKRGIVYGAGNGVNFSSGGVYELTAHGFIDQSIAFGIPSFSIWSLEYDKKHDLLYIGTLDKGMYVVDLKKEIMHFSPYFFNKDNLWVVKMAHFEDTELVLTKEELLFLNQNKVFNTLTKKQLFQYLHSFTITRNKQLNPYLYDFYLKAPYKDFELKDVKVDQSEIWVTTTLGLFKISKTSRLTNYYPFPIQAFYFINKYKLIYQEPYGNFWEVTNLTKEYQSKEFKQVSQNEPRDGVQILNVHQKQFILSAYSGLYYFQKGRFFSFLKNGIWKEKELICGTVDANNNLIVANSAGDIFILEVSNGFRILKKITAKQSIGKSIVFIHSYKDYLIIGNEKGIVLYKEGQVRLIDEEQGLTNKILTSSILKNGILKVGTLNGFYSIDLTSYLKSTSNLPALHISDLEVNFQSLPLHNFNWFTYRRKLLELPYDQNTISISFEPQHILYPGKLSYRYQLKGMENAKWSNWNQLKVINLTYLPAGTYSVLVEIRDSHFGKTTPIHLLKIMIRPPYWKSWWFILIISLFTMMMSIFVIKRRITRITQQEKSKGVIQRRLAETKMEALQSQMNPHFIFNAMNSIQNFILDNNADEALMYMGEFSKLIRQTLNNSSKIRISLEDEIIYLQSYTTLENLRFNNQITIQIQVDESVDLSAIKLPPMLIQPFVENVFVHAFNSKSVNPQLQISFQFESYFIVCEIKDNGKGMPAIKTNEPHPSRGIQLVKERLSLLQIDPSFALNVFSKPLQGTTVLIQIKLE